MAQYRLLIGLPAEFLHIQMRELDEDPGSSSSEDSDELEDEGEDGEDQEEPVQCSPS